MKVVLNSCYGGFSVSDEAMGYLDLKKSPVEDLHLSQKLAAYIEKFGSQKASGQCAKLRVEYVEPGTKFKIEEYDGQEWIVKESDVHWITATEDSTDEVETLRDLLKKDGFESDDDTPVIIHCRYGDMAVSHRYLDSATWKEELNSRAEKITKGEYKIL